MSNYCKGIYAGCCVVANARCYPCGRIARGKSTVEQEMARKHRAEGNLHGYASDGPGDVEATLQFQRATRRAELK